MQTNNILIVQQHVSSSKQISIGNLEEGLVQLREAPLIADKNIELCDELLAKADSMSQVVKDGRGGVTDASQQITGLEKDIETNSQELVILKQQMEQLKQEIKGALKELGGSVEEDDQKAYILNALTLGLFSVFGDKESAKTKALKRKINAFRDKKQECQEKEFELLRHKQTIIANMQKASGDFSSPEMAKNSLAMAEMALTEVRASVETYRCFMEEIKHQTTLALKGLESLIRFADTNYEALQGDTEHAKRVKNIFAGDFQSSAYQWLMLCCLGQTCRDALEGCKKTVFSKLSLKTEDQAEQKKIADKEIAHLKTILDSREKVKTKQIEYTREMSDSSNSDRLAEQVLDRGEPVIIEDF